MQSNQQLKMKIFLCIFLAILSRQCFLIKSRKGASCHLVFGMIPLTGMQGSIDELDTAAATEAKRSFSCHHQMPSVTDSSKESEKGHTKKIAAIFLSIFSAKAKTFLSQAKNRRHCCFFNIFSQVSKNTSDQLILTLTKLRLKLCRVAGWFKSRNQQPRKLCCGFH